MEKKNKNRREFIRGGMRISLGVALIGLGGYALT
jgi:hypothetical protein